MTRAFLAGMPRAVGRQRDILSGMLDAVELEPALRWFELACSLARGTGDELSDIDCGVGVADERFGDALALGATLTAIGGPVRDQMRQEFPRPPRQTTDPGLTSWHLHTLYTDGAQLSLVLMPASWRAGAPPGSVVLYDEDGRLSTPVRPAAADATPQTRHEWACLAWIALGDLAKYLDRGSVWEAYQRLQEARDHLWRLWNVTLRVDFAGYGLTALLDEADPRLPAGIEATVAGLDAADLRRAAIATARLLAEVVPGAVAVPPDGFRDWVTARLTA